MSKIYLVRNRPSFVPETWIQTPIATSDTIVQIEEAHNEGLVACLLTDTDPVRDEFHEPYEIVLPRPTEPPCWLHPGERVVTVDQVKLPPDHLEGMHLIFAEFHPAEVTVEYPIRGKRR